jgi:hypothetical protein
MQQPVYLRLYRRFSKTEQELYMSTSSRQQVKVRVSSLDKAKHHIGSIRDSSFEIILHSFYKLFFVLSVLLSIVPIPIAPYPIPILHACCVPRTFVSHI